MHPVKLGVFASLAAAVLLSGTAVRAQSAQPPSGAAQPAPEAGMVTRRGERPVLEGRASDMAFVAGGEARISAQVADDIFAAGRSLTVQGASADHLIIADGEMDLAPTTVHDLVAAGGRLRLRSGVVNDDVLATGGEIELAREARILGSVVLTGGRVRIEAPIGGELGVAGGRVELNGPVGHGVRIRAEEIVVGPQARVGGDLVLRGARIEVSPSAVVAGRTVRDVVKPDGGRARHAAVMAALLALGLLLMNGVIAAATPWLVGGVEQRLRSQPWPTLGVGALLLPLTPLAVALLAATVLGAPLAAVLALAYLLAMPLAFAGVSYGIGRLIRERLAKAAAEPRWPARLGWTMLGALLLLIVCIIPYVGWLAWLTALAAGMGGLALLAVRRPAV